MPFGSVGSGPLWDVPGVWICGKLWEPKVIGLPGVGWVSGLMVGVCQGPSRTIVVCLILGGSFSHGESVSLCWAAWGQGKSDGVI